MNNALGAVMAGRTGGPADGQAAFARGIQTVMWVAAVFAALGGCIGWLSIGTKNTPRLPDH